MRKDFKGKISLKRFHTKHINFICDYWCNASPVYLKSLSIAPSKIPLRSDLKKMLLDQLNGTQTISILMIYYEKQLIGFVDIEYSSKIFHAHICNPNFRRKGIMTYIYPYACLLFCKELNIDKVVFKTPVTNIGANRIKEKLSMNIIQQAVSENPTVLNGTVINYYKLHKEEALELVDRESLYEFEKKLIQEALLH